MKLLTKVSSKENEEGVRHYTACESQRDSDSLFNDSWFLQREETRLQHFPVHTVLKKLLIRIAESCNLKNKKKKIQSLTWESLWRVTAATFKCSDLILIPLTWPDKKTLWFFDLMFKPAILDFWNGLKHNMDIIQFGVLSNTHLLLALLWSLLTREIYLSISAKRSVVFTNLWLTFLSSGAQGFQAAVVKTTL